MGKVISINNQKGGVGKTTTTISMASILASQGKKVLVIDCDGSSLTLSKLGKLQLKDTKEYGNTLTDLVIGNMTGKIKNEDYVNAVYSLEEGFDILPADKNLVSAAVTLTFQNDLTVRFKTMKNITDKYINYYDYILLDAAPVLDLFSLNQLVAANEVIIVSQVQGASTESIDEMLNSIKEYANSFNPGLEIKGILRTMYDCRTSYSKEKLCENRYVSENGIEVDIFKTFIPRSTEAEKYVEKGYSLIKQFPKGKPSQAYINFIREYQGA